MRVRRRGEGIQEGDLTPMIDMTFQLIAFFMVLINFNQSEQNEKIQLPESTLAKPPDAPLETPSARAASQKPGPLPRFALSA